MIFKCPIPLRCVHSFKLQTLIVVAPAAFFFNSTSSFVSLSVHLGPIRCSLMTHLFCCWLLWCLWLTDDARHGVSKARNHCSCNLFFSLINSQVCPWNSHFVLNQKCQTPNASASPINKRLPCNLSLWTKMVKLSLLFIENQFYFLIRNGVFFANGHDPSDLNKQWLSPTIISLVAAASLLLAEPWRQTKTCLKLGIIHTVWHRSVPTLLGSSIKSAGLTAFLTVWMFQTTHHWSMHVAPLQRMWLKTLVLLI